MIDLTAIHIHYRGFPKRGEEKGKMFQLTIRPPTNPTNELEIKKDIAEGVNKIKKRAEYYYVVFEIDRDGRPAYRTVIPKTFPKKDE